MYLIRFYVIIGLITFLGLVTTWQQIQTVRYGYRISQINKVKEKVVNEQLSLKLELTTLKSPQHLLTSKSFLTLKMVHPEVLNIDNFRNRIVSYQQGSRSIALTPPR
ncbi:MAG: hypothetical protein QME51_02075 [Planctomycetota bacterium]|nr:hypothetical protein [Planctomycetota bacterium]MDI6787140.1 hypothetical protein [Planctomycetota bacterium]